MNTDDRGTGDRLDQLLNQHARSYNAPDETPRDAMWEGIQSARRARRVQPMAPRRPWLQSVAAAAAVLVLGIVIGRYTVHTPGETPPAEHVASVSERALGTSTPYRVAATEHFVRAEVLLTQYGTADGDDEVLDWARSLLADTRLLLNSPAGQDPEYRELLVDLELMLAQVVFAAARRSQEERSWVAEGLQERGVLQRLRMLKPVSTGT